MLILLFSGADYALLSDLKISFDNFIFTFAGRYEREVGEGGYQPWFTAIHKGVIPFASGRLTSMSNFY